MKRPAPDVIKRYFENRSSPAEAARVLEWLSTADGQIFYEKYLLGRIEARKEDAHYQFDTDEQKNLAGIYQRISQQEKHQPKRQYVGYRIAAAVSLLLLSAWMIFFLIKPHGELIKTAYGETQSIELSDGTKVVLNANSTLRYHPEKPREIWLNGEAFFEVIHTRDDAPFSVHTDDLVVNVLGTEFNVNTRRKKTDVVLSTGKVRLDLQKTSQPESLMMSPGDKVTYSLAKEILEKKVVNPADYSSWTAGTIVFDHTALAEVFQGMEDTYGVEIIVNDSSVLSKELSGEVVQDFEVLTTLLEKTFEIKLTKKGSKIYLE